MPPGAKLPADSLDGGLVQHLRCLREDDVVFDLNMRLIEFAKAVGGKKQAVRLAFAERLG